MASKKGESTALLPTTRPGNITTVPTSSSSSSSASTAFHRRERSASKRLLPNPLHDDEEDDDEEGDHHSSGIAAVRKVAPQPDHPHLYAREYLFMPYLPFLRFRDYHKDLVKDVIAGIVVSVVAVPQGLAYSILADLPAVMGLYTSAVPPLVYAFFGTSRQLSVGPVAIVSMFIPSIAVQVHMSRDPVLRVAVACLSSIISGLLLVIVGIFRIGGIVKFISNPVLTGFTTAAAVVIGVNQMQHILGFFLPEMHYNYNTIVYLIQHMGDINPVAVLVGVASIIFLFVNRTMMKAYSHNTFVKWFTTLSTLLCVVLATIAAYFLTKVGYFLPIVGAVPAGIPSFSLPKAAARDLGQIGDIILACMPVTCLAFMSSWSLSRKYATKFNQTDLDPNQEAFAIGLSNLVAGFFGCFPSSGSFGRTSLNAQNGARTPLSNLYAGIAVFLCLLFFTPFLYYVPMACLGGIIEISLISLFEIKPFKKAYRVSKPDFIVMTTTFLFTACVNIEVGLVVGIFVSIAVLLQELSEIHTSVMVPVAKHGRFFVRSQSIDPHAMESDRVKVIRLTASIFFGNHGEVREAFTSMLTNGGDDMHAVVVDASGVSHLDLSGIEAIEHLHRMAKEKNITVVFANAKGVLRERLVSSKLWEKLGGEIFRDMSVDEIVTQLLAEQGIKPLPSSSGWASPNSVNRYTVVPSRSHQPSNSGRGIIPQAQPIREEALIEEMEKNGYGSTVIRAPGPANNGTREAGDAGPGSSL